MEKGEGNMMKRGRRHLGGWAYYKHLFTQTLHGSDIINKHSRFYLDDCKVKMCIAKR